MHRLALVGLFACKLILASIAWLQIERRCLLSSNSIRFYFRCWSGLVGYLTLLGWMVTPNLLIAKLVVLYGAIMIVPLAGPRLAQLALGFNGSRCFLVPLSEMKGRTLLLS